MFEITPPIIVATIVLAGVVGVIIGRSLSKASYKDRDAGEGESKHHFHVDRATGIVSDISSFKY